VAVGACLVPASAGPGARVRVGAVSLAEGSAKSGVMETPQGVQ
jgi:hypothetical protein